MRRCAAGGRGSADGTSLCRSRMSAIPRAHPRAGTRACPSALRHATEGPEGKSGAKAEALTPLFAGRRDPNFRIRSSSFRSCSGFCGQDGRALASTGPSRPRRGRAGKSPKGRAHDARAFAVGTRTCRQRTSGAASRRRRARCPATAAVRVPFSWLLLFGQAKRSDPLAWMASGKTHGREAVFAKTPKRKQNQKHPP